MRKKYYSSYIETHAEAELQESEKIIENAGWSEVGNLNSYLPPFKDRPAASISLRGETFTKH